MGADAVEYIDDYATCGETHATLRIYHDSASPEVVTRLLALTPHDEQSRGEARPPLRGPAPVSGWFLESATEVQSRDARRHLDWLLERLDRKETALAELAAKGWTMNITVFWVSKSGHGGPMFEVAQLVALGKLGLPLEFDIYFADLDERPLAPGEKTANFFRAATHWARGSRKDA